MIFCRGGGCGGLWWAISPENSRTVNTGLNNLTREATGEKIEQVFSTIQVLCLTFFCFSKKKFSTQSNGGKIFHAQKIVPLYHLNKIMVHSYSPIFVDPLLPKCRSPLHTGTKMGPVHSPTNTFSQPHGNFTFGIF